MKQFRKLLFWLHLASGVIAGIFIFVMCVTGALLAFESNILDFAESDMRYVKAPAENAQRLSIRELIEKVQAAKPEAKPSGITLQNDKSAAAVVSLGRDGQFYVNPYTGDITGDGAKGWRGFFRVVEDAHRWLALSGSGREVGKGLNDAANFLFLFLAISGFYIWFPRRLTWQHFRPVLWFRGGLKGKARDFNWHNTIGFWSSMILIILTATAVVMSYQWANNLLYSMTGSELPQQQQQQRQPPNQNQSSGQVSNLPENINELWNKAEDYTDWNSISLRLPATNDSAVFTIDEGKYWNKFGRSTLTLNPENGEVIKWETYGEQSSGRQLRSWVRFTHTGETFGFIGQLLACLACIGGAFLVWTGISLAIRRFYGWRTK